jgi:UPF0755 protein
MSTGRTSFLSIRTISVLIVAVIVFALGKGFYQQYLAGPPDYSGPGRGSTSLTVTTGESLAEIGNALKSAGVIQSVDAFIAATTNNLQSSSIQPGKYALRLEMTARDALDVLISGTSRTSTAIVITEGMRATTIFGRIAAQSDISITALKQAAKHSAQIGLPSSAEGNVEGYLFPGSYDVNTQSTATSLLKQMVSLAKATHYKLALSSASRGLGLTERQVLTVASILEAEAHPRDYAKVARVIYNRIQMPMRLQMDSTVAYGLGVKQVMLTQTQLDTDTPYNTYLRDGLPPGPIDNPGVKAIEAALHPDTGNWLYFLTVNLDTQETEFTNSYNEFLTYKSQFLNFCRSHEGKC